MRRDTRRLPRRHTRKKLQPKNLPPTPPLQRRRMLLLPSSLINSLSRVGSRCFDALLESNLLLLKRHLAVCPRPAGSRSRLLRPLLDHSARVPAQRIQRGGAQRVCFLEPALFNVYEHAAPNGGTLSVRSKREGSAHG